MDKVTLLNKLVKMKAAGEPLDLKMALDEIEKNENVQILDQQIKSLFVTTKKQAYVS